MRALTLFLLFFMSLALPAQAFTLTEVGNIQLPISTSTNSHVIKGNRAYVTQYHFTTPGGVSTTSMIDMTAPNAMSSMGTVTSKGTCYDTQVIGDRLFVGGSYWMDDNFDQFSYLHSFVLAEDSLPVLEHTIDVNQTAGHESQFATLEEVSELTVSNGFLVTSGEGGWMRTYTPTDISHDISHLEIYPAGYEKDIGMVLAEGSQLYFGTLGEGLNSHLTVSEAGWLSINVHSTSYEDSSLKLMEGVIKDDHLYAISQEGSFHVFDISDPAAPLHVTSIDVMHATITNDIVVMGDLIIFSASEFGETGKLYFFDISDPAAPVKVHEELINAQSLAVSGNYLTVTTGTDGGDSYLRVYSVPQQTVPLSVINLILD